MWIDTQSETNLINSDKCFNFRINLVDNHHYTIR